MLISLEKKKKLLDIHAPIKEKNMSDVTSLPLFMNKDLRISITTQAHVLNKHKKDNNSSGNLFAYKRQFFA